MANPRILRNRPNPEGKGKGTTRTAEWRQAEGEAEKGEGGRGRRGRPTTHLPPPAESTAGTGQAIQPVRREQSSRRSGSPREAKRRRRTERPQGGPQSRSDAWGGCHPPKGKRRPPGIHPRTCAPVVAGILWKLPASQRWVAPGQGNCRRRCMAVSLAPARCAISKLVCHTLWSGGAPLHGNPCSRMARGAQQELEL